MTKANPIVKADQIEYSYGDYLAVKGISFEIHPGEVFGLLGTNGAGKTTTLEMIQGFREPSSGTIRIFEKNPIDDAIFVRENSGIVLQEAGFFLEMNVESTISWWGGISGREDNPHRLLNLCNLTHRANEKVGSLSGGERRRLDLAMALWGSPKLLILDEPTTGLDPESRRNLWEIINEQKNNGSAVLLTTHYLEEAEFLCDRITIMDRGESVKNGTLDALRDPSRVSGYLSCAPLDPEDVAQLKAESGISIKTIDSTDQLKFEDFEIREVLRLIDLVGKLDGCVVQSMSVRPRTLEEVFIEITRDRTTGHSEL